MLADHWVRIVVFLKKYFIFPVASTPCFTEISCEVDPSVEASTCPRMKFVEDDE